MGAVRVNVKLINAIDRKLVNRGLLSPNLLRSYEAEALVDTGSSSLVIPMDVAEYLGLKMVERQMVTYADGREEIVSLTGYVILYISGFDTVQTALATGNQVLIGQTVLEDLDLLVDCKNHRLIPNSVNPEI
ncbi:MAG: clan AA aspartic protease [Oscillatoria sp. SIO1A7]|nr:clan AA aspartic protease [Oscillatoria sp. SIO1A7]